MQVSAPRQPFAGIQPRWTRTGWVQRSTGTTDRGTALAMERMLVELGPKGKRAWDLLDDVATGQLSLGVLYDAWRLDDLQGLRACRADVDLCDHLAGWQAWLQDRTKADTAAHYVTHLRTLMPEGHPFWRSQLTAPVVARWLASRTGLTKKRQVGVIRASRPSAKNHVMRPRRRRSLRRCSFGRSCSP